MSEAAAGAVGGPADGALGAPPGGGRRGAGTAASLVARSVGGDPAERRRRRLFAGALAGCSAFVLAATSVASLRGDLTGACIVPADGGPATCGVPPRGLAPFLQEAGLRPGVVLAAALLVVPFAVLALQVLRLGSAARERRLAALRVQGATSGALRRLATAEVLRPALGGAAAGLPAYLALWVLLGVVAPPGWRLLPTPGNAVLVAWPVAGAVVVGAAVLAARAAARPGAFDPLGLPRRRPRPLTRRSGVVAAVPAVLLLAALPVFALDLGGLARVLTFVLPVLFVASCVAAGPWLVVLVGRRRIAGGDPVRVLSGHRLLADPRTPGRVAGVLLAVGLALGFALAFLLGVVRSNRTGATDLVFFGGGTALALLGIGLAAVVAVLSLVVGATEHLLDGRRPTAALVALGAEPSVVRRVIRGWLLGASVLPTAAGAFAGSLLLGGWIALGDGGASTTVRLLLPVAVALATATGAGAAAAGVAVASRVLRRPLAEATSAENLRAA